MPSTSHASETTDSFLDIVRIGKEAQQGVSAAVGACDITVFSVAYVSSYIAKHCLIIAIVTCKKCLISEVPSLFDIYTGFTAVQYSLLHIPLRS